MTNSDIGNVRYKFLQNRFCCKFSVENIRKDNGWFSPHKGAFLTDDRANPQLSHEHTHLFVVN